MWLMSFDLGVVGDLWAFEAKPKSIATTIAFSSPYSLRLEILAYPCQED